MRKPTVLATLSRRPKPKFLRPLLLLAVFFLILAAGYLLGQSVTLGRQRLNLSQYWQAYDLISKKYVGSIDSPKAIEGSISGLVNSLGDPFSSYLPAQAKKDLDSELSGQFEGIGAELTQKNGLV